MDDVAEANGGVFERLVEVRDAGRAPERVASRGSISQPRSPPTPPRRRTPRVRVRSRAPRSVREPAREGSREAPGRETYPAEPTGNSRNGVDVGVGDAIPEPRIFLVGSPTPRVVLHHDPLSLVHVPAAHEHTRETRRERLVERHLERVRSPRFPTRPARRRSNRRNRRRPKRRRGRRGKGRARRRRTPSPRVRRRRG